MIIATGQLGYPVVPRSDVAADSLFVCCDMADAPLAFAANEIRQILPYGLVAGFVTAGLLVQKKPLFTFVAAYTGLPGCCLRVEINPSGTQWFMFREWNVPGGGGAAAGDDAHTVEHGVIIPSWQLRVVITDISGGGRLNLFAEVRAI